jgi:hypothetical protein
MKVAAVALLLVSVVALVSATTYYKETFDGRFAFVVGHMYFMCHHCMHHPLAVPMFLHTLYFLSLCLFRIAGKWQSRWVKSTAKGADNGKVDVTAGKYFSDQDKEKGMCLLTPSHHPTIPYNDDCSIPLGTSQNTYALPLLTHHPLCTIVVLASLSLSLSQVCAPPPTTASTNTLALSPSSPTVTRS